VRDYPTKNAIKSSWRNIATITGVYSSTYRLLQVPSGRDSVSKQVTDADIKFTVKHLRASKVHSASVALPIALYKYIYDMI